MTERDVTAADGRTLRVAEGGDPAGVPVLIHHGMPGSRLLEPTDVARARERGIRLVSYDRPGYGGSNRHACRNIADCTADVRAIAGALAAIVLAQMQLGLAPGSDGWWDDEGHISLLVNHLDELYDWLLERMR